MVGIVVFALMVGVSVSKLNALHRDGALWERYQDQVQLNVMLLSISIVAVIALAWMEIRGGRRSSRRKHRLGGRRYTDDLVELDEEVDNTSIYSTPKAVDEWRVRRGYRPSASRS